MRILADTRYPHIFNANGTRRQRRCSGHLQIVAEDAASSPFVVCNECGEGYRFEFKIISENPSRKIGSQDDAQDLED